MPNPSRSNGTAEKNHRQPKESDAPPSNNLWIGNLTVDTTEADLIELFARYGAVDSVTNYCSRNYAFLNYRRIEDACAAKDALQNALLRGNSIRIEFARPAKPAKNLWVGGFSSSVTKEQLEDELLQYGKIQDFKFLRDRNSALVEYCRIEDATTAVKNMNGKRLGGEQIRVDYMRSQISRRENWSDFHDSRDGNINRRSAGPPDPYWGPPDVARDFLESSQFGNKRPLPPLHSGGRREGPPSKVLWVGYPPSVQIDEQMLHNAMILFGEIERIKSFPSRHYSFVEFRSVDEARRAKEGLQGRLFNDPRINIMFSSSELAPPKDSPGLFSGIKGPRPDMFFSDPPFGPMELFGPNRIMAPNNFAGPLGPNGTPGPNLLTRPFGPPGGFDNVFSGPDMFNELAGLLHNFQEANPNSPMGQNWRRLSPAPGILPSPAPGMRPLPPPGSWDGSDLKAFQREHKRSRIDGPPVDDLQFSVRPMDDRGIGVERFFGFDPRLDRGGPSTVIQGHTPENPFGARDPSRVGAGQVRPGSDLCWRGIIAKGGTRVCYARCVPIGRGLNTLLPEVVNCGAKTTLKALIGQYEAAGCFDIVFFLPDSEEDFAPYTEFLRYLGEKSRVGVVSCDDGTTLFLVPPSDFLTNVLNVSGPERLYGVVFPRKKPITSIHKQPAVPPQFVDGYQLAPSRTDCDIIPPKDDQVLQMDYGRVTHEGDVSHPSTRPKTPIEEPPSVQSVPQESSSNPSSIPQSGLSLTPELIATLVSFFPNGVQSSSSSAQIPLGSNSLGPTSFPASAAPDGAVSSQGWDQYHQANANKIPNHSKEEQTNTSIQLRYQFNAQTSFTPQFPAYFNNTNGPDSSGQAILGNSQIQDSSENVVQQGVTSNRPGNYLAPPVYAGQFVATQQANQQPQLNAPSNSQSYGTGNVTDATGFFHPSVLQQAAPSNMPSSQVQGTNLPQPPIGSSSVSNIINTILPDQVQQLQSASLGVRQAADNSEADRNQRYQSTLQFAAHLLSQIQQQEGNPQGASGLGNHQ